MAEKDSRPFGACSALLCRAASIAIALFVLQASTASATTYFVRESGDDKQVGSMPSKAWATLTKAARTARAGDTIIVGAGTFEGQLPVANSGTKDAAIVFMADTDGKFTGDAGPCVVTASRGSAVILDEKSHVQFRGLSFRGTGRLVVNARRASAIWFHECEFFDAASDVVRIFGSGNAHFSRCIFRDNGGLAINANDGVAIVVDECVFSKNSAGAIKLRSDDCSLRLTQSRLIGNGGISLESVGRLAVENCLFAQNRTGIVTQANKSVIAFCTIVDHSRDGCVVKNGDEVVIANSIVANNRGNGIGRKSGEMLLAHNLVFSNRAANYDGIDPGPTDLKAPPLFEDDVDYRLKEKSPAINAAIFMEVTEDLFGSHRPLGGGYDIGCHEFISPKRRTNYYVRREGDDTNHGSTAKHAWATIGHAAKAAMPGDTVYVGGGVYQEHIVFSRTANSDQPITFIADNRGRQTGDHGQVTIVAPDEDSWAVHFVNADHTRLAGFRFATKTAEKRKGVYVYNSQQLRFDDCVFEGLTSAIVSKLSRVRLDQVEIRHCKPRSVTVGTGTLIANSSDFVNNHTGVHAMSDAVCIATNCSFSNNSHAGACLQGMTVLSNSMFESNGVIGLWMKGIDHSLVELDQVKLRRNRGYGLLLDQCDVSLKAEHFEQLHLQRNAVSVAVLGGKATLEGADLRESSTCSVVARRAELAIRNSQFSGRETAIHLEENQACHIEASSLKGANQGVGILWSGGDAQVKNCLITDFATGIQMAETDYLGQLEVWNCTLANLSEFGIDNLGGDLTLRNSILVGKDDAQIGLSVQGTGIVNHTHNLLFGFAQPFDGTEQRKGEVISKPHFVAPDKQNYRLRAGSPAINAGMDARDVVDRDIVGSPRPSHSAWELGAFEYLQQGGSFRVLKWEERR